MSAKTLTIELSAQQCRCLRMLSKSPAVGDGNATLEDVVLHLVASMVQGVEREGSWENGVVQSLFGEWGYEPAPLCQHCACNMLDEEKPLEVETQHCTDCLVDLAYDFEQAHQDEHYPHDDFTEELQLRADADPVFDLCAKASAGDAAALLEVYKRKPCTHVDLWEQARAHVAAVQAVPPEGAPIDGD